MLGTICVSVIVSVWWNIFTLYFIGSQRMKSFLYFFCGTSVHYERRFLLICSTTRKVRMYIWLDFLNLRALERERWKGCWSLFLISWNCFHIFVHTKKQNLCFCLSPLVSRGLCMYSQFLPHNPFLSITFYILPFMDTWKEGAFVWNLGRPWSQGWLLFSLQ